VERINTLSLRRSVYTYLTLLLWLYVTLPACTAGSCVRGMYFAPPAVNGMLLSASPWRKRIFDHAIAVVLKSGPESPIGMRAQPLPPILEHPMLIKSSNKSCLKRP
jgi:hypothetical protein